MSDNFVQVVSRTSNVDTTTSSVTLTGVVAGNTLIAFFYDGSTSTPTTFTVGDGQNPSWPSQGNAQVDSGNGVKGQMFALVNANAGSHTVTGTADTGNAVWIGVVEVGTTAGASSISGFNSNAQSNPGAGANACVSGSIVVSGASTIVSICNDSSSAVASDEPTAGTSPFSFTSRDASNPGVQGSYRIQTAAASADGNATAGPVTTTHNFETFGIAVLNAAPAGGGTGVSQPPTFKMPQIKFIG